MPHSVTNIQKAVKGMVIIPLPTPLAKCFGLKNCTHWFSDQDILNGVRGGGDFDEA